MEILNSDAQQYMGSNSTNTIKIVTEDIESHNKAQSIGIDIPPLATVYLKLHKVKKVRKMRKTSKVEDTAVKTEKKIAKGKTREPKNCR